jgi:hypothetical protein
LWSLALGAAVVMIVAGMICHALARRIIVSSNHLILKIFVPFLLASLVIVLYVGVPLAIATFYDASYGYQLQPGESPGPLGNSSDLIIMLLLLFGLALLLGYIIFLACRLAYSLVRSTQ